MKRLVSITVAGMLACAIAPLAPHAAAQGPAPILHTPGEIRYVKGRILVQPKAGLKMQELDRKLKAHGGQRVSVIPKINVHIVQLPPQANERAVAQLLRADGHIKFAEVDQQIPPALTPNDPSYSQGWHLPKIGAPSAWDASVGEGVTIAILDSGVDPTHPDLAASLVPGYNAFDKNADTRDVYGHGTRTAGAAAMIGNNLVGGTGVAFKSKIMPIRITDTSGMGYFSSMATGLVWAADNGARVASISFRAVCGSSTVLNAAQYMRSKGGVVVGSAGNTGAEEPIAPHDAMTCVSAVDSSDSKASWSSYGAYVDVAAPGVGIYTTSNGGGYGAVSGTSFSAPITGGVYALMMAANRGLSPSELDAALFSSAVDLGADGKDVFYGYGRVDAAAAVAKVRTSSPIGDTTPPTVSIASPGTGTKVNGLVAVDVRAADDVAVARVELYAGRTLIGTDTVAPYGFSVDTAGLPDGELVLQAKAYDAAGNVGSAETTVSVANDTIAPSVTINNPQSGAVISSPTSVGVSASDNKRVSRISLTINGKEVAQSFGSSLNYTWDPYAGIKGKGQVRKVAGTYTLTATATDDAGNSKSTSVTVTVP
jgi:thermitase